MTIQLKPQSMFPSNIFPKYLINHSPEIENFHPNYSTVSKSNSVDLKPFYWTSPEVISNTYSVFDFKTDHTESGSFIGIYFDTGAETSVVGTRQAKEYCRELCSRIIPTLVHRRFRFGDVVCASYGAVAVRLLIREGAFLPFKADIIPVDIPT